MARRGTIAPLATDKWSASISPSNYVESQDGSFIDDADEESFNEYPNAEYVEVWGSGDDDSDLDHFVEDDNDGDSLIDTKSALEML